MKNCNVCLVDKDLEEFPKKGGKCKICLKDYKRQYAIDNALKVSKTKKKYYKRNKKVIKEKVKIYNVLNEEKIKEYRKEYNQENYNELYHKEYRKINKKEISENKKEYYLNNKNLFIKSESKKVDKLDNILYKFKCELRALVLKSFKDNGIKKSTKIVDLLGCSLEQFKTIIENKFTTEMDWNNYYIYWQLKYINPNLDINILNNYSNFQPLCWY